MPRRLVPALTAAAALALAAAPGASALETHACPNSTAFRCGTVSVPLDRAGAVPGTVRLAVAVERPRRGATGFLVALSGGPGQPSVPFADSFRASLAPALDHRRLVLLDQRGTGRSGALDCPVLQALGTLDVVNTRVVAACAARLGPARQFYSTTDTVLDVDAVRAAIGAPKLELMGISYGTYAAAQYARAFPDRVDGLILDSVVGPAGINGYFLDTFARLPRVLRDQCAAQRCRAATKDAVADLGRLAGGLRNGPLRGTVFDARGAGRATAIHDESELLLMIMSGDLNPFMQAALPGAISAATRGDTAPLLRLRHLAQGPPTPAKQFSSALNVATTCADVKLPYTLAMPLEERASLWLHGVDALADSAFAPFSRHAVIATSVVHDCLRWPQGDAPSPPATGPLPDVPALLLSGRLDTRTPIENSRELLALLPHGQLLTVGGTGHDVLDSDISGCAARALRRFAEGKAIGMPCRGRSNAVTVLPRPASSVSAYRSAPGVGGERGRVLFAALDTVADAQISALETLYAGFSPLRGGGLRGGGFAATGGGERIRLHRYTLVPGVRVSGTLHSGGARGAGSITVEGPGRLDGRLRLAGDGRVTGTLGGRHVRYDPRHDARRARRGAAAGARAAGRMPLALRLPSLAAAAQRVSLLRRAAG